MMSLAISFVNVLKYKSTKQLLSYKVRDKKY